jgi:hypothetical protein
MKTTQKPTTQQIRDAMQDERWNVYRWLDDSGTDLDHIGSAESLDAAYEIAKRHARARGDYSEQLRGYQFQHGESGEVENP